MQANLQTIVTDCWRHVFSLEVYVVLGEKPWPRQSAELCREFLQGGILKDFAEDFPRRLFRALLWHRHEEKNSCGTSSRRKVVAQQYKSAKKKSFCQEPALRDRLEEEPEAMHHRCEEIERERGRGRERERESELPQNKGNSKSLGVEEFFHVISFTLWICL